MKLKRPDALFLIFLIGFTQGNMMLKIVALVAIFFAIPAALKEKRIKRSGIFYLIMFVFGLLSFYHIFYRSDYVYPFFFGLTIWGISYFSFLQNNYFIKHNATETIESTLFMFFWFNVFMCLYQLGFLFVQVGGNPFALMSSGDAVKGIFSNSSVNMIVNSFFFIYFMHVKRYTSCVVAALVCLTTTYMSGLLIMAGVIFSTFLFSSSIRLRSKLMVLFVGIASLAGFYLFSPGNVKYVTNQLKAIQTSHKPRKIVSFEQTYDFLIENPKNFLIGAGMGNFSSRVAFTSAGDYAGWYPQKWSYMSEEFRLNHHSLWNLPLLAKHFNDGTANQPFSIYNQLLGEYGVLGFLFFVIFYIGYYLKNFKSLTFGKEILFLMLGFALLDYWFEYFSVIIFFEIFMMLDVKKKMES